MIQTIISNNCTGGAVMHELGMEFKTPTINLQILPEEYPGFCNYFKQYMAYDLTEYTDIQPRHREYLTKMFGEIPDMPFGLLGDIIVCFQHYGTFAEARDKWNERKAKIDYDHIGYIFHARGEEYKSEAIAFNTLNIPNKLILTQNFSTDGGVRFDGEGFEAVNNKLRIVQIYDYKTWIENGCPVMKI